MTAGQKQDPNPVHAGLATSPTDEGITTKSFSGLIEREMSQLSLAETNAAQMCDQERHLSGGNASGVEGDSPASLAHCKHIYIVSDSTGFTASHALTSVLGQFETLKIDWSEKNNPELELSLPDNSTEVRTQMFSNVKDASRIERIVVLAHKMRAMILFTLVDKTLHNQMTQACAEHGVPLQDLLGPLVARLSNFLGSPPTGRPRAQGTKRKPLSDKYYKRVEAVEFTIKQDDGALTRNLEQADVVLLGVSRSSKTPLSMYLAQQFGYKVHLNPKPLSA